MGSVSLGGTRYRAWLEPAVTGEHVFWIASNGISELWLSSDESTANITQMCEVLSWTNFRDWNKFTQQKSQSVFLEAGRRYYIEANHIFRYNTHFSVGWSQPGESTTEPSEVIPSSALVPYVAPTSEWISSSKDSVALAAKHESYNQARTVLSASSSQEATPGWDNTIHYQEFTGDGSITVRFNELYSEASSPITGLFLRNTISSGDADIYLSLDPTNGVQLTSHTSNGTEDIKSQLAVGPISFPVSARLTRSGGSTIIDIWNDTEILVAGHTILTTDLNPFVLGGIFVDSKDPGQRAHVDFSVTDNRLLSLTHLSYERWKAQFFRDHPQGSEGAHTEPQVESNAGENPNIARYAILAHPTSENASSAQLISYQTPPNTNEKWIDVRRMKDGTGDLRNGYVFSDLNYCIETSTSLESSSWAETDHILTLSSDPPIDHLDGTETVRFVYDLNGDNTRRFFRLRLELIP